MRIEIGNRTYEVPQNVATAIEVILMEFTKGTQVRTTTEPPPMGPDHRLE